MTQEEKQLLLKDLCARLPYRTEILFNNKHKFILSQINPYQSAGKDGYGVVFNFGGKIYSVEDCKPYLRPMSSMTQEEIDEIKSLLPFHSGDMFVNDDEIKVFETNGEFSLLHYLFEEIINFYNSHHFDYSGLIKKGLALEAPENMYKTE